MLDAPTRGNMGIARGASGTTVGDATVLNVLLGFRPKYLVIVNVTDAIRWEKIDGMDDATTVKGIGIDTTSAIVLTADGFTTTAALNASAKTLVWYAE